MEIYIDHSFDAGHRVTGHQGKCARFHGHTYRAEITLRGHVYPPGFVADFGLVKDLVNQWDHRFLLWDSDEWALTVVQKVDGMLLVPFNPTVENMVEDLTRRIVEKFETVHVCRMTLWETPKACAIYEAVKL